MRLQRRDGGGCGLRIDTVPQPEPLTQLDAAIEAPPSPAVTDRPIVRITDADACTLCGSCVDACVRGAISLGETVAIDTRLCTGCGACVDACPCDVLELVEA